MSFITIDLDSLSAGDKTRVQECFFALVKSASITSASQVDSAALKSCFDNIVDSRIKDQESTAYMGKFSYTTPNLD